jgi:hypothetical protein
VTIAKRPSLLEAGRGELMPVICPTPQADFFSKEGWTAAQISSLGFVRPSPSGFSRTGMI